ncbi:MAG: DUF6261 family protein [Tannerellaceae bacterium]|jgi:hypothetical protein|nr:DUF6261 family protein [Tannerellaceae bacterium]
MMKVSRFRIATLRNEEWFGFHTEYEPLGTQHGSKLQVIDRLLIPYKELYKEADHLLEILRKSFITVDTSTANHQRELVFRGLRDAVKSYLNLLDPIKQKAATKLYAIIRKYADAILKGSLVGKTPAIDNLLQDLTPVEGGIDLSAEVQLLGISAWITDLDTANKAYVQSQTERSEEDAERPEAGRLRQVRAEMDHYYINMVNVVEALLLVAGYNTADDEEEEDDNGEGQGPVEDRDAVTTTSEEDLLYFVRRLNACIARYKTLLKGRQTRTGKKGTEDAEDTEDTE